MIRSFIALKIPEEIKDKIFGYCFDASENVAGYKWEAKEKIHLTLKFIGEVKDELVPRVIDEIEFIKNYSSFDCTISRFGFFFRDNEAKILWCNVEIENLVNSLVDELNNRLSKYDIEVEKRKFKGHLTLLRIKNSVSENFINRIKEYKFDPIKFKANQVALIQSVLKPTGSEYKILNIYELK